MKLIDLIEILPFKANIDLIVKSDDTNHFEYSIKFDLGTYNFMKNIKDTPYRCPFEKYLQRDVKEINTYNISENICENYSSKTFYKVILKEEEQHIDKSIDTEKTIEIPFDLKFLVDDLGSSALVRKDNKIYIVKRRKNPDTTSYNKICIDNNLREDFFADVKSILGSETKTYKLLSTGKTADMYYKWDKKMTEIYNSLANNKIK